MTTIAAGSGDPAPIGATVREGGVNFSLFSRHATSIDLLLFDDIDAVQPARVIPLTLPGHRTYHYWHCFVAGLRAGQVYAFRAHGPFDPSAGLRFDSTKTLLDPYGRAVVVPEGYRRATACEHGAETPHAMRSVVVDPNDYDWEGDAPLRRPCSRTVIYEMHVRGFTRHPSSGVSEQERGTYAGLVARIPYLLDLGVTAVELLPVFQFDPQDCPAGDGRVNYWGYAPVSFFAPHQAYASRRDPLGAVDEFRDMVKALHRAGIEVILDVVFNHTAEGGAGGPTLCHKGLDNEVYYMLEKERSQYANYSGTGNTLQANHPIVRRMILDSLRRWVSEMHVDGFRFDLASILARGPSGEPLPNPPVLWDIESDPVLAGTKLIAEAWDAAGLDQVGAFIGDGWREWNGRFRDDARAFFRGEPGALRRFADRFIGSPDLYRHKRREAEQSVNFITCHDGFTLNDLVSYDCKHNEANGEGNRDGGDDNRSWNCGVEGPSADPAIERLRARQMRNMFTATLLSVGLPMISMGDEVRRTQHGNNNAYCHDNEMNWFDWSLVERHADLRRFVKVLIERRLLRTSRHEERRLTLDEMLRQATFSWHGVRLGEPDWGDESRSVALSFELAPESQLVHLMFNAFWQPLDFDLPAPPTRAPWLRWIDTARPSPDDIVPWQEGVPIAGTRVRVEDRSIVVAITALATPRSGGAPVRD